MATKTTEFMGPFLILAMIISVLILVFYLYILYYISTLENIGCECSEDWKRTYIKWYFILLIIMYFIPSILMILTPKLNIYKYVSGIVFVLTIISLFVIYQYIRELKEKKCDCSDMEARYVLEVYNYIMIFIYIVIGLAAVYHLLFTVKK